MREKGCAIGILAEEEDQIEKDEFKDFFHGDGRLNLSSMLSIAHNCKLSSLIVNICIRSISRFSAHHITPNTSDA